MTARRRAGEPNDDGTGEWTGGRTTDIPPWAWVAFGVSMTLGLGCAYFGQCVTAKSHSASRTATSIGRNRQGWTAGFGGGLMKFGSTTANAAGNGGVGGNPGSTSGSMRAPRMFGLVRAK
jgi:hypothetical protein